MKIVAIISEYNPFHNGHKYHIDMVRKDLNPDAVVAVMSGNFVERGEAALLNKWYRAHAALSSGIDLVLELPCIYSLSSAEFFSFGAVSLLNSLNSIDYISFGSECGDTKVLERIARVLVEEPNAYKVLLKEALDKGLSFAKSREIALKGFLKEENFNDILEKSNNILGIEYVKSIIRLNSKIKFHTIKRTGSSYNDNNLYNSFSSASAIRKALKDNESLDLIGENIPSESFKIIKDNLENLTLSNDSMVNYLKYKLFNNAKIEKIPEVSEGLHNLIYKSIESSCTFEEIIKKCKSKRYAYTKLSRILCQYFIGFENFDTFSMRKSPCPYARVLGFNGKGQRALKEIKKNTSIPLVTKIPKEISPVLALDIESTKTYNLINKATSWNDDFLLKPIILP